MLSRRKAKQKREHEAKERAERIAKLISMGWIKEANEIPHDALPVDPLRIDIAAQYHRITYYADESFTCKDCGSQEVWKAEDQLWFYETQGASYYKRAKRCLSCRKAEAERKAAARKAAGHEK